jgi:microtubule-associated protein, RP/EB family
MKPAPKAAPVAQSRTTVSKAMGGAVSNQQVEELTNQVMDMRLNLEGLEKERDFYFSKLRDIEILCQEAEDADATPIIQKILEILYATEVD